MLPFLILFYNNFWYHMMRFDYLNLVTAKPTLNINNINYE